MDNTDIKPPSDDYEVIIGDGDWIIPEGAKIYLKVRDVNGVEGRGWFSDLSPGKVSLVKSTYAIPKWVELKEGDVFPHGHQYRSRKPYSQWTVGQSDLVGLDLISPDCAHAEYRAPAPPLRRRSDTVDSLEDEIAKLKHENAQLAEKAENWRKLYIERRDRVEELKQEVAEIYEKYVAKGDADLREAKKEIAKLRTVIRAKPVLEMALREIMREAINSTEFDPEA